MIINLSAVARFAAAWVLRRPASVEPGAAVLLVEGVGTVLLGAGGYLGGVLIHRRLQSGIEGCRGSDSSLQVRAEKRFDASRSRLRHDLRIAQLHPSWIVDSLHEFSLHDRCFNSGRVGTRKGNPDV
jgi:hypothetical protein